MLKAKPCSEEGCDRPSWKNRKCLAHQEYTPSLPKAKTLVRDSWPTMKKARLKKQSENYKSKATERKGYGYKMIEFFKSIWDEREHVCYETGVYLGEEPNTMFFHHLLFKSKYPEYAFEKWNIVILSSDQHSQMHSDSSKCPKTSQLLKQIEDGKIL